MDGQVTALNRTKPLLDVVDDEWVMDKLSDDGCTTLIVCSQLLLLVFAHSQGRQPNGTERLNDVSPPDVDLGERTFCFTTNPEMRVFFGVGVGGGGCLDVASLTTKLFRNMMLSTFYLIQFTIYRFVLDYLRGWGEVHFHFCKHA